MKQQGFEDISKSLREYKKGEQSILPTPSKDEPNLIVFPPFSLGDLAAFFSDLFDVDLKEYIPQNLITFLNNLKITSEEAIQNKSTSQSDPGLSLTRIDTGYELKFAIAYTNSWEIESSVEVKDFYIAFTINEENISAVLSSGNITFNKYQLSLQVALQVPSLMIIAELAGDTQSTDHDSVATDYLKGLKKGNSDSIKIEDIVLIGATRLNNYTLYLAVSNVLDLHKKFTIQAFQVNFEYRGGLGGGYSVLAWTEITIGFDKNPLDITLAASREKNDVSNKWAFAGSLVRPVSLEDTISDLCQLFDLHNDFEIPDLIGTIQIDRLDLAFDYDSSPGASTSEYVFTALFNLPLDDKMVKVAVSAYYQKQANNNYNFDLKGSVLIAGMEFDLEFKKTSEGSGAKTSILEATYKSDTESIDLTQLLADITDDPDLISALPDVKISLKEEIFFAIYKSDNTAVNGTLAANNDNPAPKTNPTPTNKYLFGLKLDVGLDFDLGELPIVGKILKSQGTYGIKDFKFFLASQAFYEEEIRQFNADDQALIMGDHSAPPAAAAGQRIPILSKGANFRATLNLGAFTKTIPQPPTGILPGAAPAPALKAGEAGAPSGTTAGSGTVSGTVKPAKVTTGSVTNSQAQWLNIQKDIGPVTIERIGVSFKDGKIWFYLTGSFTAAGLTITLDGLGIGSSIKEFKPEVTLMGMSVDFHKGNLQISGGFVVAPPPLPVGLDHLYAGELIVKAEPFGLVVMGMYGSGQDYTTMFVFGMLDFPIGGPPIFFVTGLAGGFGYNNKLNLPSINKLDDYLLVQAALPPPAGKNNPLAGKDTTSVLDQLLAKPAAVEPTLGDNWIAAGVRFTSYELVQSFALLVVSFGHHFELAVLGRSQIAVPPLAPQPVVFAEIDLMAVLIPDAEPPTPIFSLEARLADGSFILDKAARLRGGLAFYFWANGDFVVTLGGYHPHFQAPDYYPRVDRLGMDWKLSNTLSISGGLYFALTPSALMAGGSLHALFQVDHIRAWFMAEVDFLMNFKPFHYSLSIHISIGVAADLGLTSVNMHVGVELNLWGPEFSGIATIDLTVISFSIEFGGDKSEPLPLPWDDFAKSFLPKGKNASGAEEPEVVAVRIADGLLKQDKSQADSIPVVNPLHFEIRTHTAVPVSVVQSTGDQVLPLNDPQPVTWNKAIGIVPMQKTDIQSVHHLDIQKKDESGKYQVYSLDRLSFSGIWEEGPKSLWLNKHPDISDQLAKDTTIPDLLMGVSVQPKKLDPDHTFPVEISALLVELEEIEQYDAFLPPLDKISLAPQATVVAAEQLVCSALAKQSAQRQAILQALQAEGLADATEQLDARHFSDPKFEALSQSPLFI